MKVSVLLVEPGVPENVGASARAIKNMGLDDIILINPCEYNSGPARWLAHGAGEILDNARIFSTLSEALKGYDLVIGTTARYRSTKQDYIQADRLWSNLENKRDTAGRTALVFGREDSGLTNDELSQCDITSSIPMAGSFPSLNLAQAVMIYLWELRKSDLVRSEDRLTTRSTDKLKALKEKVKLVFDNTSLERNDKLKGRIMERIALASDSDINLMHSFTGAVINDILKKSR